MKKKSKIDEKKEMPAHTQTQTHMYKYRKKKISQM